MEDPNHVEIKRLINDARDANGQVDPRKAASNLRDAGYGNLADQIAKAR